MALDSEVEHLRRGSCRLVHGDLRLQPLPLVHRVCELAEAVRQFPPCDESREWISAPACYFFGTVTR